MCNHSLKRNGPEWHQLTVKVAKMVSKLVHQVAGSWIQVPGSRILGPGSWIQDPESKKKKKKKKTNKQDPEKKQKQEKKKKKRKRKKPVPECAIIFCGFTRAQSLAPISCNVVRGRASPDQCALHRKTGITQSKCVAQTLLASSYLCMRCPGYGYIYHESFPVSQRDT